MGGFFFFFFNLFILIHALALTVKTPSFNCFPGRDYENLLGIYICSRKGEGHTYGVSRCSRAFSIDTPFTAQGMNRDEQ